MTSTLMVTSRTRLLGSVLVSALLLIGACTSAEPSVRPFPEGDRAAASRPPNPSATPVTSSARVPIVPGHLFIPSIAVNASVLSLGTEMAPDPFLGGRQVASFIVPPDLARVGWWSDGPPLGGPGMAVLLGHSQVGGGYAVFNRLADLRPGDDIVVEDSDGSRRVSLEVSRVVPGIAKDDDAALQTTLAENARTADVALITCSGRFDASVSESEENTAVFATIR